MNFQLKKIANKQIQGMDVVRAYVNGTHGSLPIADYATVGALLSDDFIFVNEEQQHDKGALLGAVFPGKISFTYLPPCSHYVHRTHLLISNRLVFHCGRIKYGSYSLHLCRPNRTNRPGKLGNRLRLQERICLVWY